MKKICFIIFALLGTTTLQAQYQVNSFFDNMGIVRLETQELSEAADTLVNVFHRADDVVWSRIVYRIVDMRFKQNYQLYNPVSPEDPHYKSLFLVMLNAIKDGMEVYEKSSDVGDIKPYFNLPPMAREMIPTVLNTDRTGELGDGNIATSEYMLLNYDSVADVMKFNNFAYDKFVRNQLKYIIQEVIFFDRHYSRLFKKITAIAPLNADNATFYEGMPVMEALYGQILFWVPFDAFRPYMAKQYMTPKKNDNQRVTYDEFFEQRKFSSYIIGTNNVYNRMIPELVSSKLEGEALREAIKKEQDRVENELLNVEQDLWEY
jgi:gliding motility associated protien GldN